MNILVTGSTGFIGSALVPFLLKEGHAVTRLVRSPLAEAQPQAMWDPEAGSIDSNALAGIEAVVHLAGESSIRRWTAQRKARMLESRVKGTALLCEALVQLDPPPRVLVCASGKDLYGDRGDELLQEDAAPGTGFLAKLISQWEAATAPAAEAGIRVANTRFGLVLGADGGALAKMLLPFKLGMGAKVGRGRQYVSWISLTDLVRAVQHALTTESLEGPVNTASPGPLTNAEFTRTLGKVLSRPAPFISPVLLLRMLYGEGAGVLAESVRLDPGKLLASGFEFLHPELEGALRAELGRE